MTWYLWLIVALYSEVTILVFLRLAHILSNKPDVWTLPPAEVPPATYTLDPEIATPPVVVDPTVWQQRRHRARLLVRSFISAASWFPHVQYEGCKVLWRELTRV